MMAPMRPMADAELLAVLLRDFSYDAETGLFHRKRRVSNSSCVGEVAGTLTNDGYIHIRMLGKKRQAHRLAWLFSYGEMPRSDIDHRNGIRSDNRLCNLRLATDSQNKANSKLPANNTTGFKGVSPSNSARPYKAAISHNGSTIYLGVFSTAEEAHSAYCEKAREVFGDFARVA